jgi:hypothetical protein
MRKKKEEKSDEFPKCVMDSVPVQGSGEAFVGLSKSLKTQHYDHILHLSPGDSVYAWFAIGCPESIKEYQWYDEKLKTYTSHCLSKKDPVYIFKNSVGKPSKTLGNPLVAYKFIVPLWSTSGSSKNMSYTFADPYHFTRVSKKKWGYRQLNDPSGLAYANFCPSLETTKTGIHISGEVG